MRKVLLLLFATVLAVTANAQLTVSPGDSSMCAGDTLTYTSSGMTILGWVDTLNQDTSIASTYDFTTMVPGTHTLYAVGINFVPADTDTIGIDITVHAKPTVSIMSSAGGSICEGSSVELIATTTGTLDSIIWSPGATLDTVRGDTVMATPDSTTTYMVNVFASNGCTAMESVTIAVNGAPDVTISSTAEVDGNFVCLGNSATLTAMGDTVSSYEWSPTATLSDSTTMSVIATPTVTTTYTLIVTDSNGCTATATKQVKVNQTGPTLTFIPESASICQGGSVAIDVVSTANVYSWTPPGTVDNPTAQDVVLSPTSTTTYTLTAKADGCTSTGTITVTVTPAPSVSVAQTGGNTSIALDETAEFTATCPTCISYQWQLPGGNLFTANNVQTISPNTPGNVTITVIGYDGSCNNTASANITVLDQYNGTPFGLDENGMEKQARVINANGELNIQAQDNLKDVRLFNLLGEEILRMTDLNSNSIVIPTSHYAGGVYILNLGLSNGERMVEKVYVNR